MARGTKRLKLLPENKAILENSPRPNRDLWAKSFYSIKPGKVELWRIACTDDAFVALYMSKDHIKAGIGGNEDMLGRNPVWHVWVDDERIYCGQSEQTAYKKYHNAVRDYDERNK